MSCFLSMTHSAIETNCAISWIIDVDASLKNKQRSWNLPLNIRMYHSRYELNGNLGFDEDSY
jgi:hypothetical protein